MRKVTWGFIVGTAFVVVLAGLLLLSARAHRATIIQAPPLTLADISRLAPPDIEPSILQDNDKMASDAEIAGGGETAIIPPPPLVRVVTRAEALDRVGRIHGWRHRSQARATFLVADGLATACGVAGVRSERGGWYWEAAQEAEKLSDAKLAKAYYREALNYPLFDYVREWCLSRLAWYEDDSEVAAALLQASCATDEPLWLADAARLAHTTGSLETRDFYLARLQRVQPELAQRLAEEFSVPTTGAQTETRRHVISPKCVEERSP